MLGAGKELQSEPVDPAIAPDRRTKTFAGSVVEIVNAAEVALCGDALAGTDAAAYGLAVAGRRSAVRLGQSVAAPDGSAVAVGWVRHRIREVGRTDVAEFELLAGSAQEAADHCLLAHFLAGQTARPWSCAVDRHLADSIAVVELPDAATVAGLLDNTDFPSLPRPFDPQAIIDAATAVVQRATAALGRSLPPLALGLPNGVRCVIDSSRPGTARSYRRSGSESNGESDLPPEVLAAFERLDGDGPQIETAATATAPSLTIGFFPAGNWGERMLLETIGALACGTPLHVARADGGASTTTTPIVAFSVGRRPLTAPADARLDLLVLASDGPLTMAAAGRAIDRVRDGGGVLLHTAAGDEAEATEWPAALAGELAARRIKLRLAACAAAGDAQPASHGPLVGAALRVLESLSAPGRLDPEPGVVAVAARSAAPQRAEELLRGAAGVREITPADAERGAKTTATDFGTHDERLWLPAADGTEDDATRRGVHEFHVSGSGPSFAAEPPAALPLIPALLLAADAEVTRDTFPLLLAEREGGQAQSLGTTVDVAIEAMIAAGESVSMIAGAREGLLRAARRVVAAGGDARPAKAALDDACADWRESFDVSAAARPDLEGEIAALRRRLPGSGTLLGLGAGSLVALYAWITGERRRRARLAIEREMRELVERLAELLKLDDSHAPAASTPEALSSTLGAGHEFVDPVALAASLPGRQGSKRLDQERRRRIETSLRDLQRHLRASPEWKDLIVVHPAGCAGITRLDEGVRTIEHADGLRAAIGLFDGFAASALDTVRAWRVARLESRSAYDAQRHAAPLHRLDWRGLDERELPLLPQVVVVETGRRLRGETLAPFSELLRAARPVHVLVDESTAEIETSGYQPGLGYLAVAHREAFVLQGTLGRPAALAEGLERLAASLAPAVAIVATPNWFAALDPVLQLESALRGRATPCFRYDPASGENWAERFELAPNPSPELPWPEHPLTCTTESGEEVLPERFTFAHAAALDPSWRAHFRILPPATPSEDRLEIAAWIEAAPSRQASSVPFVHIIDHRRRVLRAAITRELAWSTRERARAWRILQELAGVENAYARQAAERARAEALKEAELRQRTIDEQHAEALERVGRESVEEAMQRLAAALLDGDALSAPGPVPPAALPAPSAPAASAQSVGHRAEAESDSASEPYVITEPYIDSVFCTTCNECTNLNPRMFVYNKNRQAEIADPAAGTFEQLVKAAEKCPARCIHPGRPRPGDKRASDALIARAAKFD